MAESKNKSKKIIAVDLGGTNLRVSLVQNNRILKYIKNSTPKTKRELLKVLYDSIGILMSKNVAGIGVGSPGPLKDGIIKNPPNIPLKKSPIASKTLPIVFPILVATPSPVSRLSPNSEDESAHCISTMH